MRPPLFPTDRRIAARRVNSCGVGNRVLLGFRRASLRRVGDQGGCATGQTSLGPRPNLRRVGVEPTAHQPCDDALWGPFTFAETDTALVPAGGIGNNAIVKSIPVDFSTLPNTPLRLIFTAGDVIEDDLRDASLRIYVGGGAADLGGTIIWSTGLGAGGDLTNWTPILNVIGPPGNPPAGPDPIANFANPNPVGGSFIKFVAHLFVGTGLNTISGFRNYTIQINSVCP